MHGHMNVKFLKVSSTLPSPKYPPHINCLCQNLIPHFSYFMQEVYPLSFLSQLKFFPLYIWFFKFSEEILKGKPH